MARQPQTIRAGNNRCRKCLNALDVPTIAKRQRKQQPLLGNDLKIQQSQTISLWATIAANMCLLCLPSQQPQQDSTEQQSLLLCSEASQMWPQPLKTHETQTNIDGNNRCHNAHMRLTSHQLQNVSRSNKRCLPVRLMLQQSQNISLRATIAANMYLLGLPSQQLKHGNTERHSLLI